MRSIATSSGLYKLQKEMAAATFIISAKNPIPSQKLQTQIAIVLRFFCGKKTPSEKTAKKIVSDGLNARPFRLAKKFALMAVTSGLASAACTATDQKKRQMHTIIDK
ncbi:MAG: hypothetical protein LBF72_03945 [Holosporales bacterium]|nr:hypothetical protein [Holosporales bacterium]